ncbi:MAG: hypothetical protein Q9200_000585 [Gallowayella weberi]
MANANASALVGTTLHKALYRLFERINMFLSMMCAAKFPPSPTPGASLPALVMQPLAKPQISPDSWIDKVNHQDIIRIFTERASKTQGESQKLALLGKNGSNALGITEDDGPLVITNIAITKSDPADDKLLRGVGGPIAHACPSVFGARKLSGGEESELPRPENWNHLNTSYGSDSTLSSTTAEILERDLSTLGRQPASPQSLQGRAYRPASSMGKGLQQRYTLKEAMKEQFTAHVEWWFDPERLATAERAHNIVDLAITITEFAAASIDATYAAIVADPTAYDDDDEDVHESLRDLNKLVDDAESPSHRDWREVISELKQAWRMLGWEEARHGVQANSSNSNSRRVNQVPTSWDGLYR